MSLVPMYDAGKIGFVAQLLPGEFYTDRPQTDTLGSIADTQQRNALPRDMAAITKVLQGIMPTVKCSDNSQARRAAVHRIELNIVGERHRLNTSVILCNNFNYTLFDVGCNLLYSVLSS